MPWIDLKDAGAWVDRELSPAMREGAVAGLQSSAWRGLQIILTEIIPSRSPEPVDRGLFRAGWRVYPEHDGATLENVEPHAPFVEHGVRAANVKVGRKMIEALVEWVRRKGIADGKEAVRAAWGIAKAMKKRGIFNRGGTAGFGILSELVNLRLPSIIAEEVRREIERRL